ncbi:MAG: preprotein translocase subunit YajC [Bdellovibrionota bacterium]
MKKFLYSFILSLFFILPALAQDNVVANTTIAQNEIASNAIAQNVKTPTMLEAMLQMLPLCIIIYFIFYFFVTRPQEQINKQRKEMLESLKSGDKVVTSCGIYGKVSSIDEDFVMLEISQGTKVKFKKNALVAKV